MSGEARAQAESVNFGPVEVVVNDARYVREHTLFAALDRVEALEAECDRLTAERNAQEKTLATIPWRGVDSQSPWQGDASALTGGTSQPGGYGSTASCRDSS